jgi:PHD/YefM family antitoxin component YafN of YafNO toxin-antitoxin module
MTSPQSLPVEEARKKFADLLDDSQFRSTHTAITRRGKTAGYVVPPEWYARAVEALSPERTPATATVRRPAPTAPQPRKSPAKPKPTVEERPLSEDEAKLLVELSRSRASEMQLAALEQDTAHIGGSTKDYAWVSVARSMGLLTDEEMYGERPAGSEETSG